MSVRKQALKYTAAALAVAAVIVISSTLYLNGTIGTGQAGGTSSRLVIQLTDPPIVPRGASSLNLTYSSIDLLVGEPANGGAQTTKTIALNSGGTLDLLELQNVSQTIALASLPDGTTIYSFNFTVTGISMDVNGTKSQVTLATGGNALTVTLERPSAIQGDDVALLRLNPVVVTTPGGYQMIPSAVGIIRAEGQGEQGQEQVGSQQLLTNEDLNQLEQVQGNLTAKLTALSISGNSTTITVQVQNTGNSSVTLYAIAIHGNFTSSGQVCGSGTWTSTETQTTSMGTESQDGATTTSTSTTTSVGSAGMECEMEHADEVLFAPVNSTVTGTSCAALKMGLANGYTVESGDHGLTLAKGQCVTLTFSGPISFGFSHSVLLPSTGPGHVYLVHVIASEGANLQLSCTLPTATASCSAYHDE